jgi:hypothetical protein
MECDDIAIELEDELADQDHLLTSDQTLQA